MATFLNIKKEKIQPLLLKEGLALWDLKTPWEILRMKGSITAVLFASGKLLLQGKEENVEKYRKLLVAHGFHEEKKPSFVKETGRVIGSDETLKGDTFGGLVVAAVLADDKTREELVSLGVQDSKKINDNIIPALAQEIEKRTIHVIRSVYPEEYNHHSQTALLNKLHAECAQQLSGKSAVHVVDKYPGCTIGDIRTPHAEDKYVEVAAASVLARKEGLAQLQLLSHELGYPVPKGSTHVKDALLFLKKSGKDAKKFVKMHFSNVKKIMA